MNYRAEDPPGPAGPRTDLALEAAEGLRARHGGQIPGVRVTDERQNGIVITRVDIHTEEGASLAGKPQGTYVTIEASRLRQRDRRFGKRVADALAGELAALLNLDDDAVVFVVGLGNWHATPDALGPRVVSQLLVTRHLRRYVPVELTGKLRSVCALAPGVLGITGMETGEIIQGVVQRIRPDAVLAVDALASRSINRILTTVQIADTGINPGSGVGHDRVAITRENLGIPVIAVGIPTVVSAVTIAHDTLNLVVGRLRQEETLYRLLDGLDDQEQQHLLEEVLNPSVGDLMVTPKEIDVLVRDMSQVVAAGINSALQPGVDWENMMDYLM